MGQGSRLNPAAKHVSERIMGNTLEQALPFLTTTWMYALYIDDARATSLGLTYVAYRALYPIVYAEVWDTLRLGASFARSRRTAA